jgi:hypothetical protein
LYEANPTFVGALAHAPEWYLLIAGLTGIAALGLAWHPLLLAVPLLVLAVLPLLLRGLTAARTAFPQGGTAPLLRRRLLTGWLHLLHPVARLYGRLTRPRARRPERVWPRSRMASQWCERWEDPVDRLGRLELAIRGRGLAVVRGGDFDRWDLQVRGGPLGAARVLMAVEEHGGGRQLVRLRWWPRPSAATPLFVSPLAGLAIAAAGTGAWVVGCTLGVAALWCAWRTVDDCGTAFGAVTRAIGLTHSETP